jgi:hypothetical protein
VLAHLVIATAGWSAVLLRLAYLGVTNAFALLRLLPMSDRDKDVEILALRHQLTVLERQLSTAKVEEPALELFESVTSLHLTLSTHLPQHNAWRPRLMTLGSAVYSSTAAKSSGGHPLGMAQVGRIAQ